MKLVINRCYGGFGLSQEAHAFIAKRKGWTHACNDWNNDYWYSEPGKPVFSGDLPRDDPDLVAAVETLGVNANGRYAELKIVTIPDNINYEIKEYDGLEHVTEQHRSWS